MSSVPKSYGLMSYYGWANLGDATQAYAMSRLLPGQLFGAPRTSLSKIELPKNSQLVLSGFFHEDTSNRNPEDYFHITNPCVEETLFAGVHLARCGDYLKLSKFPVGARESYTKRILERAGVDTALCGCATMTLPRYTGPRSGVLHIEDFTPNCLTQGIPFRLPWARQWELMLARLGQLATAEEVFTTRLHVAIPCLAFGTPVTVPWRAFTKIVDPPRMVALDDVGFEYDKPNLIDMAPYAKRFTDFLWSNLGLPLNMTPIERGVKDCPIPII